MNTLNKPTSLLYNLLFAIALLWLYSETLPKKKVGEVICDTVQSRKHNPVGNFFFDKL